MKAVIYAQNGDASVLQVVQRRLEEPAEVEVLVRVVASGVNPTDWKSRSGAFGRSPSEPTFPTTTAPGSSTTWDQESPASRLAIGSG